MPLLSTGTRHHYGTDDPNAGCEMFFTTPLVSYSDFARKEPWDVSSTAQMNVSPCGKNDSAFAKMGFEEL